MPKLFKARLIDCGRNGCMTDTPRKMVSTAPRSKVSTRDNLARRTNVATYYGSEYSSLREVDDLKIFDNSNESQPPKLVCVYPWSAFIAENGSNELKVFWVSADPVGTSTIGDTKKTEMNAKRYQSELILKARRVFGSQR
jgi:hypothetical protein